MINDEYLDDEWANYFFKDDGPFLKQSINQLKINKKVNKVVRQVVDLIGVWIKLKNLYDKMENKVHIPVAV